MPKTPYEVLETIHDGRSRNVSGVSARSFAEKLNVLLEALGSDENGRVSANEFVRRFNESSTVSISTGYLSELRSGRVTNPRIDLVEGLARYFDISPAYFVETEEDSINIERVRLLGAMRGTGLSNLGARTSGLSPDGLRRIVKAIEAERDREGLNP